MLYLLLGCNSRERFLCSSKEFLQSQDFCFEMHNLASLFVFRLGVYEKQI